MYFDTFTTSYCFLCDNFEELDTNTVNKTFTVMKEVSKEKSIMKTLIKFYKCELNTFKRLLAIK
jgi:hypothetical protein